MMQNIKNWKWWLVLPVALIWLLVIGIPWFIILVLEWVVRMVEYINFGERHNATLDKLIDWVQKDYDYEE